MTRMGVTRRVVAAGIAAALAGTPAWALAGTATGTTELIVAAPADTGGGTAVGRSTTGQYRRTVTGPMPTTGDGTRYQDIAWAAAALGAAALAAAATATRARQEDAARTEEAIDEARVR